MPEQLKQNLQDDVDHIGQISIVPNILNVICKTTGMGFAAIARVTEDKWIACSVRDDIAFGLKPGGELQIKTTICDEIRESRKAVIIDHVSEDDHFQTHHTPLQYGFQSYISVPIIRKDDSFFGTLCAIDPHPHKLNTPEVIDMFTLFADLISFHLDAIDQLNASKLDLKYQMNFTSELEDKVKQHAIELEKKNEILVKTNKELQEFNYISSHDLQEPLRKIQTFVSIIQREELSNLSNNSVGYFEKIRKSAERMQLLINDLLSYSHTERVVKKFEPVDLDTVLNEVVVDLKEEITAKGAEVIIFETCTVPVVPFQIKQLFYNIIGNAIKYSSKLRPPRIEISAQIVEAADIPEDLDRKKKYCKITIADNGIGFDPQYREKIFELFQRLHHKSEFDGTGIGLAIVKKIVENHEGLITATGAVGSGAEFTVYIPG